MRSRRDYSEFAVRFSGCLLREGFEIGDVVECLGVHPVTVYRWKNGTGAPDICQCLKLCELFGVDLTALAGSYIRVKDSGSREIDLATAMRNAGYSVEDFAWKMGVTQRTLIRWRQGDTRPGVYEGILAANLLGVSPYDLWDCGA